MCNIKVWNDRPFMHAAGKKGSNNYCCGCGVFCILGAEPATSFSKSRFFVDAPCRHRYETSLGWYCKHFEDYHVFNRVEPIWIQYLISEPGYVIFTSHVIQAFEGFITLLDSLWFINNCQKPINHVHDWIGFLFTF